MDLVNNFDLAVELEIGGTFFGGWTSVKAKRTVKDLAGAFEVGLAQSLAFPVDFIWEAQPGAACTVWIAGYKVITGYINRRHAKKDGEKHTITVSGRGKTQDMVDCSHIDDKTQYNQLKPSQIIEKAAKPFGIRVVNKVSGEKPIPIYRYFMSDTAFEVSHDVARQQGITLRDDENGNVVMRDTATDPAAGALILGVNIKSYDIIRGDTSRHSAYKGKGQLNPGSKRRGKSANQVAYRSQDNGVQRYRPLIVYGESDIDEDKLQDRVAHEACRRFGEDIKGTIEHVGYLAGGGLWLPDTLVPVSIPDEGINDILLIESVEWLKDEKIGSITRIGITRKEAFEGKATGASGAGGGGGTDPLPRANITVHPD